MRAYLSDILCCAACRHFPLTLTVLEATDTRAGAPSNHTCDVSCGLDARMRDTGSEPCRACATLSVQTGYFRCTSCARFYFIVDAIPRMLTEDFAELIDLTVPKRFPESFAGHEDALEVFLGRLSLGDGSRDAASTWGIEDMSFWEGRVYGDAETSAAILREASRARPDAGNRTYPRERAFFRRLRSELPGDVLLDLGCGLSQTVRTLCHPARVGYSYIGADLSISALKTSSQTLEGDFVQCTAERVPFRSDSVDAVLMFGTLHHLADHETALRYAVGAVRPEGWLALDEVVSRRHLSRRLVTLPGRTETESAHNESVDPDMLVAFLASAAEIVVQRREYSVLRGLLAKLFGRRMPTRPWLTKAILAADALWLATVGRLSPILGGRELLVLARKQGHQSPPAAPAVAR